MKQLTTRVVEHLNSTEPPWVATLGPRDWERVGALFVLSGNFHVFHVNGAQCKTKSSMFTEFGKRLGFPSYFGRNWDAFEECIRDLEWLPARGYILVITCADKLLSRNRKDFEIFVDIMNAAGAEWSSRSVENLAHPGTPFHVILLAPARSARARQWKVPRLQQALA